MLAEIQELQNDAVSQLIATLKSTPKDSYTFRAPKVTELKKCYKQASIVTGHIFYLPIMKEDVWRITKYQNGIEETLTIDQFRNFVLNK